MLCGAYGRVMTFSDLPEGSRRATPAGKITLSELRRLLPEEAPWQPDEIAKAKDELAGGHLLEVVRAGQWHVIGVAATSAEARAWMESPIDGS